MSGGSGPVVVCFPHVDNVVESDDDILAVGVEPHVVHTIAAAGDEVTVVNA
jgi:hypothetical protein